MIKPVDKDRFFGELRFYVVWQTVSALAVAAIVAAIVAATVVAIVDLKLFSWWAIRKIL